MLERFYDIGHLTTKQLQDLYRTYIKKGWKDFEYYELKPKSAPRPELTDGEVLLNIEAGHEANYCVFMQDVEGEEDGIMIALGLSYFDDFAVFLHLPAELLDEIIQKYSLTIINESKDQTLSYWLAYNPGGLNLD